MKYRTIFAILISSILFSSCENKSEKFSPYNYVNPFIGTGGHGHTYPGATMPFGMVQLSPDTRLDGWDGCSGYHYSDSIIFGFSHTHLSGTGVSDYGDILLMPFNYSDAITYQNLLDHKITPSKFSKSSEIAKPGYYKVNLSDSDIDVELTSEKRVGIHKYTFNNPNNKQILLDLNHRDQVLNYSINIENSSTITGSRISKSWAEEQHVYFAIEFSENFEVRNPKNQSDKDSLFKLLQFNDSFDPITVKVALSTVSIEGAIKNLNNEAGHWNFDDYKNNAKEIWTKALNKILINSKSEEKLKIFYSALYHTMIVPNIISDVDGKYRGMDKKIHKTSDQTTYTIFSLWDTFRAAHPLYTIIEQDKTKAFIHSFLQHYKDGGRLPVWELSANETDCMIGYHSVSVIADAYLKGIKGFDPQLALDAMTHSANLNHFGLNSYRSNGFIAAGDEAESVSKNLEYAYDDWCIAQMAKSLGNDSIYSEFIERAQYYKNLFNPEVGFMQSKMNGGWSTGFDPTEVNFNFTEANSWQYSLFAPQDISGLIDLYGGEVNFEKQLDELFSTEMELSGRHQADITGLIGQYAHGNEPSHHMAYLYNYIGKPWKTQEKINEILIEQYQNQPDGLSGNEDCGQMSAWYVLSSLGFYSVTPGLDYYTIGKPHFESAEINLENGNTFKINTKNLSESNIYIQSAILNGIPFDQSFINHNTLMNGGELIFNMGPLPNTEWGKSKMARPITKIKQKFAPVPYFSTSSQTFTDSLIVQIKSICNDCEIFYSIDDTLFKKYSDSINIYNTSNLNAYTLRNGQKSFEVNAKYIKIKGGRSIEIDGDFSNQYSAGGKNALIDYLKGSANFRTGYWQGYQGQNFSASIDLGNLESINKISVGTLQDIKSWIWFPNFIKISISSNNKDFHELAIIDNDFPKNEYGSHLKSFTHSLDSPIKTRYIKVEFEYPGDCPSWHLGNGGKAWVFIDEIEIN